jgi:hypothetical protein
MAKDPNHLAGFETENTGGLLAGFLAEENELDKRSLWRLGSWGVAAVGAVILALLTNQSSIGLRRDQVAAADLARQSQQIQSVAKESQNEARRLASAIDTLNGDRDRLYSRVAVVEQGLDSVTGAITRQKPAAASSQTVAMPASTSSPSISPPATPSLPTPSPSTPSPSIQSASTPSSPAPPAPAAEPSAAPNPSPPPAMSPVATTPPKTDKPTATATAAEPGPATVPSAGQGAPAAAATSQAASLVAPKSMMAPLPDSAAAKPIEPEKPTSAITAVPMPEVVASVAPAAGAEPDASEALPKVSVQRTEFGVDVGGANSVGGLRALWRGLLKSRSNAPLAALQPIIVVKESNTGLGMQLRLVAGPFSDAAAAAKICAAMIESQRACETTVFDGQRLAMKADEPPASAKPAVTTVKPTGRRRGTTRRVTSEEPPQKPEPTTLSSFFGGR